MQGKELEQLGTDVAEILGFTVERADSHDYMPSISLLDGNEYGTGIKLQVEREFSDKVVIRSFYGNKLIPFLPHRDWRHPIITVTGTRGAEQIAKAIKSRLLPDHETDRVAAIDGLTKHNKYMQQVTDNAQRCKAAGGDSIELRSPQQNNNYDTDWGLYANVNGMYFRGNITGSGVYFQQLSLSIEQAEKVIHALFD